MLGNNFLWVIPLAIAVLVAIHHYFKKGSFVDWKDVFTHEFIMAELLGMALGMYLF